MLSRLLGAVPNGTLRSLKRLRDRSSLVAALVEPLARRLRGREVRIEHGAAAGLLFSTEGGIVSYGIGTAEPTVQRILIAHVRPGGVFYDIGANVGFLTLVGAQLVGSKGAVVAFEPAPATADLLEANVARNALDHVRVMRVALGDQVGEAAFTVTAENQFGRMASLSLSGTEAIEQITVPVQTLDGLIAEGLPPPTAMKIDIEGAETAALAGMAETLAAHRPTVLCELHNTQAAVAEVFQALGYTLRGLDDVRETDEPFRSDAVYSHLLALPE